MPLKIAVQMDPIEKINIKGDSSFALMLEAQLRGHEVLFYTPDSLAMVGGDVFATMQPCELRDEIGNHVTLGAATRTKLTDVDVILLRQDI
jgi:glutathione synthase